MIWRRLLLALLFSVGLVAPVARAVPVCAATARHTALVVDTGDRVERRCVGFAEDSISGKDVLDRAAVGAVYKEYSYGAAVCSLLGVGNPADDCLGERSGNHWTYFRAAKGSAMFTPASQGVSTSEVHDGDVEGWRWKTGVPPYSSASDVCAAAEPAPTTGSTATVAASAPPSSTARVGGTLPKRQNSTDTPQTAAAVTTTAGPTTTTTTTTGAPQLALPVKNDKGGSPLGLAAVGALIAGIGVATWRINRRRNS